MASKVVRLDDLPPLQGDESVPEKVQALYDYLFSLRQTLEYLLSNLSSENFNPAALEKLKDSLCNEPVADQIVKKTSSGFEIGKTGNDLNLVGTIYINGVLFKQEETNETA